MLNERRTTNFTYGKESIIFFFQNILNDRHIKKKDIELLCSHAPEKYHLYADDLIDYCLRYHWIILENDEIFISKELLPYLNNKDQLNDYLINSTINTLFNNKLLESSLFEYDSFHNAFYIKSQLLPISLFKTRNVLASQGFFIREKKGVSTLFFVNQKYESLILQNCKKQQRKFALKDLLIKLKKDSEAGELAELFAVEFEIKRLGLPLQNKVKRISDIDVTAGYDIISYNSAESTEPDRFIEVKAISNKGFFWTKNEYEKAITLKEKYYLYLIDLTLIQKNEYVPQIICNPANIILHSDDWAMEPQSYRVIRTNK